MSSTGIIGRKNMMPTNSFAAQQSEIESGLISFPGLHEGIRQIFGTIYEIHPERPLIKAYTDSGGDIANGDFISLNHSTQEIAEKFGKVRKGMRVNVLYTGPNGASANATIIGTEGERNINEPLVENTAERGLFAIFTPGIGV
jgi:hypothetical protein